MLFHHIPGYQTNIYEQPLGLAKNYISGWLHFLVLPMSPMLNLVKIVWAGEQVTTATLAG